MLKNWWMLVAMTAGVCLGSVLVPGSVRAQDDAESRRHIAMQQLGYPGMFSTRLLFPIGGLHLFGGGVTFLPELTGVGAEYRYMLGRPKVERFAFHLGGGSTYYYISEDGETTSTIGGHIYFGTLYRTRSNFALGADLGYIGTSGSESSIRSFKIEKGLATTYINFSVALFF